MKFGRNSTTEKSGHSVSAQIARIRHSTGSHKTRAPTQRQMPVSRHEPPHSESYYVLVSILISILISRVGDRAASGLLTQCFMGALRPDLLLFSTRINRVAVTISHRRIWERAGAYQSAQDQLSARDVISRACTIPAERCQEKNACRKTQLELKFYLWESAGCIIQGGRKIETPQSTWIGKSML